MLGQNLIRLGQAFRVLFYSAVAVAIVFAWEAPDIGNIGLSELTLNMIIIFLAKMFILCGILHLIFNPSEEKNVRVAWATCAAIAVIGGAIAFYLFDGFAPLLS